MADACGCDVYRNGATATDYAEDLCLATEAVSNTVNRVVCSARYGSSCPGGQTRCVTPWQPGVVSPTGRCFDTPGRWADRKCARKLSRGKCRKRRVRANCAGTCGVCTLG